MKTIVSVTGVVLIMVLAGLSGCTKLSDELLPANNGIVRAAHPQSWMDTSSANFHGIFLKGRNWDLSQCASCHGGNYSGGTSGQSCFSCHRSYPHPDLWDTTFTGFHTSTKFHGTYLRANRWRLDRCQSCHGSSFDGGKVEVSCMSSGCHVDANGTPKPPDRCNTCHGDFRGIATDTLSWAPPRAINGDTLETSAGVGAHQAHLAEGEISDLIHCTDCHAVPAAYTSPGHIGTTGRAAMTFSSRLAAHPSADGSFIPQPSYDTTTLHCSNVYCHGNWKLTSTNSLGSFEYVDSVMTGNNRSPHWTGGGDEAVCGTCHNLPPVGHQPETIDNCGNCHTDAGGNPEVDASGEITPAGKAVHINGKVNVFGLERDF